MVVAPLLGRARRFVAVDSMRFRRPGEREATLAFVRDEANDRAHGIEDVAGGLATSLGRVSAVRALGSIAIAAVCLGGLVLALIAMVWAVLRRVIAKARKQPFAAAPMRRAWRGLALLGVMSGAWLVLSGNAANDLQVIGNFNATTAIIWALGHVFVLGSALVLPFTWRGEASTGTWSALSRWTARSVMLCAVISAGYQLSVGVLGWKTWAG